MPSGNNDIFFLYLPVEPRDLRWGLHVTGAGRSVIRPNTPYPPPRLHPQFYDFQWERGRTLPEYQLVWITSGDGEFESPATGVQPISAGTVFLLLPGIWHRYRPKRSRGWTEYWVGFNGDYARRLQAEGFVSPDRAVIRDKVEERGLLESFNRIFNRLHSQPPGMAQLIAADVVQLLALASATQPHGSTDMGDPPVADRLVGDALRIIWNTGAAELSVDSIVRQLPATRRTLERHFVRRLGHGVYDEIVRCRLARARQLLPNEDLSLEQVAAAAGFADVRALRRAFCASEKISPQEYRRWLKQA